MTRHLHGFLMNDDMTMAIHLDKFDKVSVGLQTLGDSVDEVRQLVNLLSGLLT